MRAAIFFPTRNICYIHAGADYMLKVSAEPFQSDVNIPQALFRLFVRVTDSNNLAVFTKSGRTGHINSIADFYSARVPDDRFPLRSGRNLLSFSHLCAVPGGRAATDYS